MPPKFYARYLNLVKVRAPRKKINIIARKGSRRMLYWKIKNTYKKAYREQQKSEYLERKNLLKTKEKQEVRNSAQKKNHFILETKKTISKLLM